MAQYPSAAGTDANLFIAVNNLSTTLNGALTASGGNSGANIAVGSTTGFPTAGFITIDTEAIAYTGISGNSFTGITRGADGTTAASHINGVQVFHNIVAGHHNTLKDEMKAVEGDLVAAFGTLTPSGPNATDTSILTRIQSLAKQILNMGGLTNWYDTAPSIPGQARNLLTNGGMEIWQRGTSFSSPAAGTYTADRWKVQKDGTPTFTVSRESTNIDSGQYSLKLDVTAAGGGFGTYLILGQYFEAMYANALNGKTVTVTARVKCSVASKINLRIGDGTGSTNGTANVGTSFETITVTRAISGNVNDGDMQIDVGFASGLGGTAVPLVSTTYIDSIMLTIGSAPVAFVPAIPQVELAQCQRYYQTQTFDVNRLNVIWYQNPNDYFYYCIYFPVQMRVTPTMTYNGGSAVSTTYYAFPPQATNTTAGPSPTLTYPGGGSPNYSSGYSAVTHQTTYYMFTVNGGSWTADAEI